MLNNDPDTVHQGHSRSTPATEEFLQEPNTEYSPHTSARRTSDSPPSYLSRTFDDRESETKVDYSDSDSDSSDLKKDVRDSESEFDFDELADMSATRPPLHRPTEGRSQVPLLKDERRGRDQSNTAANEEDDDDSDDERARISSTRRSTFRSRTPDYDAKHATRRKYIYAAGFLLLSLISFTVQTETAVYVQHELGWEKPYCMLYVFSFFGDDGQHFS